MLRTTPSVGVADEGEQVDARLIGDVGQDGLDHAAEVARGEPVVPAAEAGELGAGDAGGRADDQRLDEALAGRSTTPTGPDPDPADRRSADPSAGRWCRSRRTRPR